jgi:hypothetical protein
MTHPTTPSRPGDKMPDGTIYASMSPDTGKAMYTTLADAPLTMRFNKATTYATDLDAHGHQDWRLPTKNELNVLFNNKAAIGGFDATDSDAGSYWSSSQEDDYNAWGQPFSDGDQITHQKCIRSSVRCVR